MTDEKQMPKKVSFNYYLKHLAVRDDNGRILTGYGRAALRQAISEGRVLTENRMILVETLKNL